ncbi:MAG: hypothetical protein WC554_16385, partial [Clostridia bacterium]
QAEGKSHSEGGIKAVIKDSDKVVEIEGGEFVVNKKAVQSSKEYDFEGIRMKIKDILEKINSDVPNNGENTPDDFEEKFMSGGEIKDKPKYTEVKTGNWIEVRGENWRDVKYSDIEYTPKLYKF